MSKGRIVFVAIVATISIVLIALSLNSKGYDEVGRVNEYVLYYDTTSESDILYERYILKNGFYEVSVYDAIENEEISNEYQIEIMSMIDEWEQLREEND